MCIRDSIVTMLGGTIQLKSEKGKGSRFTVEIPMQSAEELPERINKTQIHHNRCLLYTSLSDDNFALSPEYDLLYTELTGAVVLYICLLYTSKGGEPFRAFAHVLHDGGKRLVLHRKHFIVLVHHNFGFSGL